MMMDIRCLAVLTFCLWVNSVLCSQSPASHQLQRWAELKSDNARTKRSTDDITDDFRHRDYDGDSIMFAKLILRELAQELRNENGAASSSRTHQYDVNRDIAEVVAKRKPFWQPMGGPLPVETRLASFGQKIVPDHSSNDAPNRFKAMRYGRR